MRKTFVQSNEFHNFSSVHLFTKIEFSPRNVGKMDKNMKIALKFKHYAFPSSCPFHQLFNVFIFFEVKNTSGKDDKSNIALMGFNIMLLEANIISHFLTRVFVLGHFSFNSPFYEV